LERIELQPPRAIDSNRRGPVQHHVQEHEVRFDGSGSDWTSDFTLFVGELDSAVPSGGHERGLIASR